MHNRINAMFFQMLPIARNTFKNKSKYENKYELFSVFHLQNITSNEVFQIKLVKMCEKHSLEIKI